MSANGEHLKDEVTNGTQAKVQTLTRPGLQNPGGDSRSNSWTDRQVGSDLHPLPAPNPRLTPSDS